MNCKATRHGYQCSLTEGHDGPHKPKLRHQCHWPDCTREVPAKMWGCKLHWFKLPKLLRDQIWAEYVPGQEIRKDPSVAYLAVAERVQDWIRQQAEDLR